MTLFTVLHVCQYIWGPVQKPNSMINRHTTYSLIGKPILGIEIYNLSPLTGMPLLDNPYWDIEPYRICQVYAYTPCLGRGHLQ